MNKTPQTSTVPFPSLIAMVAISICIVLASSAYMTAQQAKVLHNFLDNGKDAVSPQATMIFDEGGNLYGTSLGGGALGAGTVFELSRKSSGGWVEKTLHSFKENGIDGVQVYAGVIFDASGNLYGTTYGGGSKGGGTVFELVPETDGNWTENILYNFAETSTSGALPFGSPVFDSKGNLYGTAELGGTGTYCGAAYVGCGMVYELTPKPGGGWGQRVLYNFGGTAADGYFACGPLLFDAAGNLYGVTSSGGVYGGGMAFELMRGTDGNWTEKDLHDFNPSAGDGQYPFAGLIFDSAGNLYGTTYAGGVYSTGTAYKLTAIAGGAWTESIIYSFGASSDDGRNPYYGTLIFDAAGNLYGTTGSGGSDLVGTAFRLTPADGGTWTETPLIDFTSGLGQAPYGGLTFDGKGNLYGTTSSGGSSDFGTVFEIIP